jgi:PAS domain S-box-containing protein
MTCILPGYRATAALFVSELAGRDLEAYIRPLTGPAGDICGSIGWALDLTERTVTEKALRISEHSYRSLMEEAPYAICRCTASGQLLQVNRAMLDMLGYDSASEADLLVRDLPFIFDTAANYDAFLKAVQNGVSDIHGMESGWLHRDGRVIQVRVSGRAIKNHDGDISHLDVMADNVTDKKQLQEQLWQAQKMQVVGQLAGGVAHDFNNLLTVIGGHVEMLMSEGLSDDVVERLNEVKQATDRAAALTKQLLAFSRRQVLQNKVVNINQVIRQQTGMLARLLKENVELTFGPGQGLGYVKADPNQMEQVLMNLAVNAQDAMPRGGRLTITTTNILIGAEGSGEDVGVPQGEYVRISVSDTGEGMDPHTLARIFEPFFTTKKLGKGTGLGLAMVYGIVKQSGGHIRVASERGAGTTFHVYLPRVAAQETAWQPSESGHHSLPHGTETILFAEDEAGVRTMLSGYLKRLGYRVLTAQDGAAALELARSYPGKIHLLLSDFMMPRMGGRELAAELQGADPDLKVIFISGYAGHNVAPSELDLPNQCFLPKPLSMELIATTIREALDRRS